MTDRTSRGSGRRGFLATIFAGTGLVASYGTLAAFAVRFLYPSGKRARRKIYVASVASLPAGNAVTVTTPTGEKMVIAGTQEGIKSFSARCPHLGCQVFWRPDRQDFHCPCHGGVFDKNGKAVAGPPAAEGKNLKAVEITVEGGSVFAEL